MAIKTENALNKPSKIEKYLKFNPDTPLPKLPIVGWLLTYPMIATLLTAITIPMVSYFPYKIENFNFSVRGINYFFFEVMKVPLSILAATLTLLGLIAVLHRSAQTYLQIRKATEQNIFSNYYKHKEEYFKSFTSLKDNLPKHIRNNINENFIDNCYRKTFPSNSPSNFTLKGDTKWTQPIDKKLIEMSFFLLKLFEHEKLEDSVYIYEHLFNAENSLRNLVFLFDPFKGSTEKEERKYRIINIIRPDSSQKTIYIEPPAKLKLFEKLWHYVQLLQLIQHAAGDDRNIFFYNTSFYADLSKKIIAEQKKGADDNLTLTNPYNLFTEKIHKNAIGIFKATYDELKAVMKEVEISVSNKNMWTSTTEHPPQEEKI